MTTPKLKKVVIDGIDVSSVILKYEVGRDYANYMAKATISISQGIKDLMIVDDSLIGSSITIQRGVASATEKYIFRGEIRHISLDGSSFLFECADKLFEAMRTNITFSYDKNIDSEAGVVSEIFKDLINTYTSLTADGTSIQDSGAIFILDKFICRDVPIYERLTDLAKGINWQFYYDSVEDKVFFEPKGYTSSSTIFQVGINVTEVPVWEYNSDALANQITVRGAEQLVESTEFFSGDGTNDQEIQLVKTPISVKIYVGASDYNGTTTRPSDSEATLQAGGKLGSTSGTFYYQYDEDSKVRKVFFGGTGSQPSGVPSNNTNNIEVRYTYKLPVPVVGSNQSSIDKYGLHEKIIVKSDLKDVNDAENYMQGQLDKFSEVFATTKLKIINEENIDVGRTYSVIDNVNDISDIYLVTKHLMIYPNTTGDEVVVGDELWKTDEWDIEVWDRLKRLEEQQTETADLLVHIEKFPRDIYFDRRYFQVDIKNVVGSTGIYGHPVFGLYGTAKYGATTSASFVMGHATFGVFGTSLLGETGTAEFITIRIIPGNNTYEEYLYDNTFIDESTSTGTLDTGAQTFTLADGETLVTNAIALGQTYNYGIIILGTITGGTDDIKREVSFDKKVTWQTFTDNIRTAAGVTDNLGVYIRLTNQAGGATLVLNNTENTFEEITSPAIKFILEE